MPKGIYPRTAKIRAIISAACKGRRRHSFTLEHRAAISAALMGHPVTPETCAKISAARKERPLSEDARRRIGNGHARWLAEHSFPGVPTNIEYALQMLLEAADIDYEAQRRLGSKTVDFYSPSLNIVFEADGTYWHQDKIAEQVRDEYLINQGIGYVFHFSEDELDQWKVRKLAFDQKQAATGA